MLRLKDKVAVITGSTGNIGKSVAQKFAAEGAKVVVTGRSRAAGEEVVKSIVDAGGEAVFIKADVLIRKEVEAMVANAIKHFGHVDIMVASAGPNSSMQSDEARLSSRVFAETDPDDVLESISRATRMKLYPVSAVVPHMVSRKTGSVLFITTQGGLVPTPGQTAASLHAGGLIMMTKVLAKELGRSKIRVNAVAVTLVADTLAFTRFTAGEMTPVKTRVFEKISKKSPYGLAKPDDIAEVAAFVVSDGAMFVTGQTVSAAGGSSFS